MAITDFAAGYPGLGQPSYTADSGATAVTTTPKSLTATFAASADPSATQPQITRIKGVLVMYTMGTAVGGQIDFTMTDGTHVCHIGSVPVPVSADANPVQVEFEAFDSGLTTLTNIVTVTAIIATTTSNVYSARLYVAGGN
jgi:hypothetical protein